MPDAPNATKAHQGRLRKIHKLVALVEDHRAPSEERAAAARRIGELLKDHPELGAEVFKRAEETPAASPPTDPDEERRKSERAAARRETAQRAAAAARAAATPDNLRRAGVVAEIVGERLGLGWLRGIGTTAQDVLDDLEALKGGGPPRARARKKRK